MNQKKRDTINEFVDNLREILGVKTPVDVEEVVTILRGEIVYEDCVDGKEAKIEKVESSKCNYRITLSKSTSQIRDRFTVAHEIGHLFLHMGYLVDDEKWNKTPLYQDSAYYRFGHNEEEYEANEFAAALLMPKGEFFKIAKKHLKDGVYDVEKIAKYFEVSIDAAKNRGRWIGLFSWG